MRALVEATKQAFIVRDREVADPAQMVRRPEHWLSELELKLMAAQVGEQAQPWPHTAEPGDTVWMGAKDQHGTMVSFVQSIYWEFGSGLVIPDTGPVWNNPAVALLKDGRRISYGCIGGEGRPQTQDALLTRYLYDGLPLDEAISRGRWLLGRTWGDSDDDLKLEQDLAGSVGKNLAQRRHRIKVLPTHSELMGHAGALVALPNGPVTAASDPRSDGVVLVGRIR